MDPKFYQHTNHTGHGRNQRKAEGARVPSATRTKGEGSEFLSMKMLEGQSQDFSCPNSTISTTDRTIQPKFVLFKIEFRPHVVEYVTK